MHCNVLYLVPPFTPPPNYIIMVKGLLKGFTKNKQQIEFVALHHSHPMPVRHGEWFPSSQTTRTPRAHTARCWHALSPAEWNGIEIRHVIGIMYMEKELDMEWELVMEWELDMNGN